MQGKVINGFELKSSLGRGGMAEVWYAENEIGKPAAVKVLKEDLSHNEQLVDRFRNEAIVMVKLDHPNIRQVYGYGTIDDRPCIVMEYLEGNDLKALMKQGRHFTDVELKKWWNQLVDALNYTHAQGIIHRDIKPSNIFIDKKGDVKLLDFGIAKVKESISATQTGAMMGTLMYMSPEQVDDAKHLGPATDVYSLAVSFVHLLSGRAPYDTTKSSDFKIREGIVYNPLDMTGVPADWQAFLEPYLAKKSTDRPALRHFDTLPNLPKQKILEEDEGTITDEVVSPPKKKEKASSQAKLHDKPLPKKSHAGALSSKKTQEIQDTLSKPIDAVTEKPKGKYYAIALLSFTIVAFLFTLILGFTSSDFLTKYYTAVFDVLMYTLLAAIALSIVGFIRPNWLGLQCRKEVAKTYLLSLLFCLLAIMGVGNHKPEAVVTNSDTQAFEACQTVKDYRNYISNFGTSAEHYADAKHFIDQFVADSIIRVQDSLDQIQIQQHAEADQIAKVETEKNEDVAYKKCTTIVACESYLKTYPNGRYVNEVKSKKANLEEKAHQQSSSSKGEFSVSSNCKVIFAKGNLQYQASKKMWRIAPNPWDVIGEANSNISSTYNGWIDLFGWGTGDDPTKATENNLDYSNFTDWGPKYKRGWRTLTKDEWEYLLDKRTTTSSERYAKAKVNNVCGVILLPDNWSKSTYSLNNTNNSGANYASNSINASTWNNTFSPAGAVFLPAGGYRDGTSVVYVSSACMYSTASFNSSKYAWYMYFISKGFIHCHNRYTGRSVRLVHSAE